jgi:phosphohistidine phosphatase
MLTLSLLRHAKSSWSDARLKDCERPLNERGERDASRMGAFMARRGLVPDLVLCSTALRARRTLDLVLPRFGGRPAPQVINEDALYLASPGILLRFIRQVGAGVRHIMVVGHDPGLHSLALQLAASGHREDMQALEDKFPTTGLAVIAFDLQAWSEVQPGGGHLEVFMTPKRLPGLMAA